MDEEVYRPSKREEKPQQFNPGGIKPGSGVNISGVIPPHLRQAIKEKLEEAEKVAMEQIVERPLEKSDVPVPLPSQLERKMYTSNSKLDELLEGVKGIVNSYEPVTLPSMGKFYSPGVAPADGVINVRCMTGEEDIILATTRHIKKGNAINMIFKNCVKENIVPEKLLSIDRVWLLIYLRGISLGTDYQVEIKCPECSKKFSYDANIDTLAVDFCPEEFGPDKLTGELPVTKYKFTYRLPTGRDENLISTYREKKIAEFGENAADDTWAFRTSLLITDIEGLTDQRSIQSLVSRLPIGDVSYLRNVINERPFGVETDIDIMCPYCYEEFKVDLPIEASFFYPKPKEIKE